MHYNIIMYNVSCEISTKSISNWLKRQEIMKNQHDSDKTGPDSFSEKVGRGLPLVRQIFTLLSYRCLRILLSQASSYRLSMRRVVLDIVLHAVRVTLRRPLYFFMPSIIQFYRKYTRLIILKNESHAKWCCFQLQPGLEGSYLPSIILKICWNPFFQYVNEFVYQKLCVVQKKLLKSFIFRIGKK